MPDILIVVHEGKFMRVQLVVTGLIMSWLLGDQPLSPTTTEHSVTSC